MKNFTLAQRARARQIAEIMRELGDDCTEHRLIRRGVTRAELDTLGEAATERANADAVRQAA
ncbi:hypothetical protein [Shinella pollutisoli]|uniref:Uncharacterized protein n=1 Tax=Shinella pollutisoli TaxID=2250594 RepID=A0ABV7D9F9_9HYPH|nr:hypothetical protein [Shinella pollutisoli]